MTPLSFDLTATCRTAAGWSIETCLRWGHSVVTRRSQLTERDKRRRRFDADALMHKRHDILGITRVLITSKPTKARQNTNCLHSRLVFTARRYASACTSHVRASVSVSVTSRCSIKRNGLIDLFLAWRLLSISTTLYFKEIQVSKNKGSSLWNFSLNSGLRADSVINCTAVGQLSWQYLRDLTFGGCSSLQWSSSSVYSTIPTLVSISDSWYLFTGWPKEPLVPGQNSMHSN